jgi:hypothetical protein
MIDTSKARMSTISPPLGLAGATPLSVIKGVELALRSEGAVDSTTGGDGSSALGAGCGPDEYFLDYRPAAAVW